LLCFPRGGARFAWKCEDESVQLAVERLNPGERVLHRVDRRNFAGPDRLRERVRVEVPEWCVGHDAAIIWCVVSMTPAKRMLIVGAATGIGAAGARRLASDGWQLALLDIAREPLDQVAAETESVPIQVDASDAAGLAEALEQAIDALGGLDAAWSNVGIQVNGAVEDTAVADFERCLVLNVRSHFVCAKTVFPHLARAGGGSFLITASNSGLQTERAMVAYATTKAAAVALVRNLARDAAPAGIRVNALCPGYVDTPFNEPIWENFGGREAFVAEIGETIPLARMATPEEVAEQAAFIFSEAASLMTGQALAVDGGELIS
jgi:NAD(P)-dependent dehydrogenase (short-subunit alcohol dehydrogenase family)